MNEHFTARTIILNEQNQILLLKYKLFDDIFWLAPGGKIENNETPYVNLR